MRHLLLAATSLCLFAGAAQAQPLIQSQEGIALQNEILQLQNQVQQLQQNQGGGNGGSELGNASSPSPPQGGSAPSGDVVASLLTQVQQLQSQIDDLRGKVDELQNQVKTEHDQTEQEIGDLKFAMGQGGAAPGTPGAATPATPQGTPAGPQSLTGSLPPPPTPAVPAATPATAASPAAALKSAELAYSKKDYASAEAGARAVVTNAPKSPQAYHAQFLLAESLTAEGKPQDAAIAYDDAYNRDRNGAFAGAALLGLAGSLAAINQNSAACDTLASFNSQFTSPAPYLASRAAAVKKRAGCQ